MEAIQESDKAPNTGSAVTQDAVRAVSIVGRIIDYFFLTMFTLGLAVIGIASFMTEKGTTAHRFWVSFGYVAFFGIGFGLLFLSQYVLRSILAIFFNAGVAALTQPPGAPNPGGAGNAPNASTHPTDSTAKH
jgi:hypothetical protein